MSVIPSGAAADLRRDADLVLLGAYVLALPFMWFGSIRVWGQLVIVADWVFIALAAVVVARSLRTPPRLGRFHLALGLYLAAMALSVAFSSDPGAGLRKLPAVAYLVGVAACAHAVVTARTAAAIRALADARAVATAREVVTGPGDRAQATEAIDTRAGTVEAGRRAPGRVAAILYAWILATAISVLLGLLGVAAFYAGLSEQPANPFVRGYGSLPPGNYPRIAALFVNINMYCNFLIVGLAATWWGWYRRPRQRRYPALLTAIVVATAFTFSPGIGALAVALALLATALPVPPFASLDARGAQEGTIAMPMQPWRKPTLLLTLALAALSVVTAALSPAGLARGELSPSVRALTWQDAARTFLANPMFGGGLGVDPVDVRFRVASGDLQHLRDAHSIPLNVAAQAGLVGLGAWLLLIGATLRDLARLREPAALALAIALVAAWMVHGLTGSLEETRHLWVLLGLAAGASQALAEPASRRWSQASKQKAVHI